MSAPPPGDGDDERPPEVPHEEGAVRTDAFLRPLFTDSTLWPILIVVMVVLATFFGSVLLMAVRERSLAAVAALLGLAWLTTAPVGADLRRRRLGATSVVLLLLWAISLGVAAVGAYTGAL